MCIKKINIQIVRNILLAQGRRDCNTSSERDMKNTWYLLQMYV